MLLQKYKNFCNNILFYTRKKSKNQHCPLYHLIHIIICVISEPTTKDDILLGRCLFVILSVNYRVSFIVDRIIRLSLILLAKQVPDTRTVGKDAMTAEGTVNRAARVGFNPRTHTGCDFLLSRSRSRSGSFNPRTHTGCDPRGYFV